MADGLCDDVGHGIRVIHQPQESKFEVIRSILTGTARVLGWRTVGDCLRWRHRVDGAVSAGATAVRGLGGRTDRSLARAANRRISPDCHRGKARIT